MLQAHVFGVPRVCLQRVFTVLPKLYCHILQNLVNFLRGAREIGSANCVYWLLARVGVQCGLTTKKIRPYIAQPPKDSETRSTETNCLRYPAQAKKQPEGRKSRMYRLKCMSMHPCRTASDKAMELFHMVVRAVYPACLLRTVGNC